MTGYRVTWHLKQHLEKEANMRTGKLACSQNSGVTVLGTLSVISDLVCFHKSVISELYSEH